MNDVVTATALEQPPAGGTIASRRRVDRVRLGIVGCGRIAESHIPAALAASGLDLVALADPNSQRLDQLRDSFGLSCFATPVPADLVGRVDAVVISVPNHLHHPVAATFLSSGVHVLCEKPLANTAREARHLCELAELQHVALAVGYVKRFEPNADLMKRLLDDGFLGVLDRFEYAYGTAGGWTPVSGYSIRRHEAGGGVLTSNGSHLLDRILHWFGSPSSVVYRDDSHGGVEANCLVELGFDSGLAGTVALSKTRPLSNRFRLYGEQGCMEIGQSQHDSVTFWPAARAGIRHVITPEPPPAAMADSDYFRLQLEDFGRAITAEGNPRVSGPDGLRSVELIEHCYRIRMPLAEPWVGDPLRPVTHVPATAVSSGNGAARAHTQAATVLVTGASGFVGSRLCEVLHMSGGYRPRPLIHHAGRAAYLARHPLEFAHGDLTDPAAAASAIDGCDAVVHLARGADDVMIRGLENVLRAAVAARVKRFVHVSSVAVYGDTPLPASIEESAVPSKTGNPYGDIKLAQEHLVAAYGRKFGLPVVILRPPHIFGPCSHFVTAIVERLSEGRLPLVDGGDRVCNLVYVDNLIEAVLLCLEKPEAVGQIFHVTDRDRITWRTCLLDIGGIVGMEVPEVSSADLSRPANRGLASTLGRMARVLLDDDFRMAARDLPGAAFAAAALSRAYAALPNRRRARVRALVSPRQALSTSPHGRFDASDYLIASQRRTVVHSCEKAHRVLGYTASIDYSTALERTRAWICSLESPQRVAYP